MKKKLVVIGNGMAGARAVEDILRRGGREQFDITIFGAEPHGNYNRILLSGVLGGSHAAEDIFLHPLEWYRENNLELRSGTRVQDINRAHKEVLCSDGEVTPYDVLLLATGSRPFVPDIAGLSLDDGSRKPGIFTMRTLDDCSRIASYANKCERAVVVGGGLLGLEAARGLMRHGAKVTVVHRVSTLMNQQLDVTGGALLKKQIEKLGIEVRLETETVGVQGENRVTGVKFGDGSNLDCDMVVFACGITPRIELARECGLSTDRGVLVDDQMRSIDDDNIYVVGECASHRGATYGLVAPLWEQARVLANVLTGTNPDEIYEGSSTATKLKVMGIELASMGRVLEEPGDEVVTYCEERRGRYKKLIIRDGQLLGAILLGDLDAYATLLQTFERGTALPDDRAHLLFDFGPRPTTSVMLEMPDDAIVCQCNGVTKGMIRRSAGKGNITLAQVSDCTRAGTGCGTCKSLTQEIINWVQESAVRS